MQESIGNAGPAPTYEDLLSTPHDEDLFDYYATSQLVYLDAATGKSTPFGKPAIYTMVRPSSDQTHLLVGWLHRPYSYQVTAGSFPQEVEVWDRGGKTEYKVASLPLADRVPLAGVRTGPGSINGCRTSRRHWLGRRHSMAAIRRTKVPFRDKLVMIAAPFRDPAARVFQNPGAIPEPSGPSRRHGAGQGLSSASSASSVRSKSISINPALMPA